MDEYNRENNNETPVTGSTPNVSDGMEQKVTSDSVNAWNANETSTNETYANESYTNESYANQANTNETNANETSNNQENKEVNYVFWAEEASAAAENQRAQTQTKYEAPNYQSNFSQGPVNYGSATQAGVAGASGKKPKKPASGGKKFFKLVGCAAAFGLVAGLVFQGVNRTADMLFPNENKSQASTTIQSTAPVSSTTVSQGTTASTDLTDLVENTMPSIVSITSTMTQDYSYFGQVYQEEYDGSGSGIIVGQNDDEILIATNNHVVDGAKAIAVNFIDDTVHEAKVKGTDSTADLAVVAVEISDLDADTLKAIKVATLGSSDDVKVGQMAIAIGNALGSGQSVTVGYISAKNRQVNTTSTSQGSQLELLQTDAAINPGNSGGALLNINGEVIGINDMKYADTDVEGMGYAIPISEAIPVINELMNREILDDDEKGYLGISGSSITEDNNYYDMPIGVYVSQIAQGGAAEEAGMKKGDIITEINGVSTKTIEAVQEKVNNTRAGSKITVTVMRSVDGEYQAVELDVTLKDSSTLNKLQSETSNAQQGNFGYSQDPNGSDQSQNQGGNSQDNGTQDGSSQDNSQSQDDSGSQSDADINDIFQQFFNQFN